MHLHVLYIGNLQLIHHRVAVEAQSAPTDRAFEEVDVIAEVRGKEGEAVAQDALGVRQVVERVGNLLDGDLLARHRVVGGAAGGKRGEASWS